MKTALLTSLAMLAFASNSLLARWALGGEFIDPLSFASIRIVSGAVLLAIIVARRGSPGNGHDRDWRAALALFLYLLCFSFAYLNLQTGSGALILFAAAQLAMFAVTLCSGERFTITAWLGSSLALGGLLYLLWPGLAAPPLGGGLLMAVAGIGWGVYSLRGRYSDDVLHATAQNFLMVAPPTVAVALIAADSAHWSLPGIAMAMTSGMLTSALGYVVWYAAVKRLAAVSAATVQLSVPAIAAAGGMLVLGEVVTPRFVIASMAILGGIALVVTRSPMRLKGS